MLSYKDVLFHPFILLSHDCEHKHVHSKRIPRNNFRWNMFQRHKKCLLQIVFATIWGEKKNERDENFKIIFKNIYA